MSELVVPTESFWDFSLALYAKPGCAELCLELQNQWGIDVNVVLFCIWYGRLYGNLPRNFSKEAAAFSRQWRTEVVQVLRDLRTDMKGNVTLAGQFPGNEFEGFRQAVKKLELAAERKQQEQLQRLAEKHGVSGSIGADSPLYNLRCMGEAVDAMPSEDAIRVFTALLAHSRGAQG